MFSRSTGKLIGFTKLGGINEELNLFERRLVHGETKEKELATHALTVMARGLTTHFNFPIGYFPSCGFDSHQLYPSIWEAVSIVELCGLKGRSFVCDGASPNRRFFRIHRMEDESNLCPDKVVYWTWNKFNLSRKIFFFSDPPHLMKTLRNNFENSHGNNNTRHLMVSKHSLLMVLSFPFENKLYVLSMVLRNMKLTNI